MSGKMRVPIEIRLKSKLVLMPNGCLEFNGLRDESGYGLIWHRKGNARTHRVSWEIANGPIPDGLWVLHKCDNPPCVNPDHLFLGTPADNMVDMVSKGRNFSPNKGKTHCPQGHPYDESNTRYWRGNRHCLTCGRASDKKRYPTRKRKNSALATVAEVAREGMRG